MKRTDFSEGKDVAVVVSGSEVIDEVSVEAGSMRMKIGAWRAIAPRHCDWVEAMGWHKKTPLEAMGLIASEVGEAKEAMIEGHGEDMVGEEIADIALRVGDFAVWRGIDIEAAVANAVCLSAHPHYDATPNGCLDALFIATCKTMNICRGEQDDERLPAYVGEIIRRLEQLALMTGVDLAAATSAKVSKNLARGNRGRMK